MENYDNYDNYEEYRNSPSKDESFQEYGELVSVKIIEYYYVSDGNSYDQHYYVIRVDIDGMSFTIDRSYIDFVELHRLLIKKYPKTMLLKLPLAAYTEIERKLSGLKRKKSSGNIMSIDPIQTTKKSFIATRDSFLSVRENFLIGGSKDYLINPYKYEESISDKKDELDEYLQLLMIQSELITSEEFLLFLDEEYKSMHDTDPKEPLSIHDILLLNQTENKCVVNRTEDYYISLTPQQMLLWRFRTLAYDIGFSVEINGEQKVPYTRYSAHQAPICGSVEPVATNSVCLLKWDNSYSKCK